MLAASVYGLDDARAAAAAGSTEMIVDPFLRHPAPPAARLRALAEELATGGTASGCDCRPSFGLTSGGIWRNGSISGCRW